MNVAVELGVRELRSLRREGQRLIGRRCPCAYVILPEGPAERKLLDQARIGYSVCKGSLLVLGHAAVDLARSLKIPCLTPFEDSRLPAHDGIARQVAVALIESVLPPGNPAVDRCALAVPGLALINASESLDVNGGVSTAATLSQFVKLRGYHTSLSTASYAVGLAELGDDALSGIVMHLGAGQCQASLLHRSREVLHTGIPRGEDSVIAQWAKIRRRFLWDFEGHCYLHQTAVREWRDQRQPSLDRPANEDDAVWKECVEQLLTDLLTTTASRIVERTGITARRRPHTFVCTGGICALPGFDVLVRRVLASINWPVPCREIRTAADPVFSVCRGLLILSECLAESETHAARAA